VNEEAVLQLRNVTKKIGRRTIVDNLSFDVPKGEVFVKIAVIVSSHLLSEMELMRNRVAIIQTGKLIDVRTISDYRNVWNREAD
jgi:ABC-type multidrug transport system ATPase subunit